MLYISDELYIIFCWFCFVHQIEESPPPPPAPAADPLNALLVPSGTNQFEKLRGHCKIEYAIWDHVDVATEIITHIITKQQLSGYTLCTFAVIVDGYRVQQTALQSLICAKHWQAGHSIFLFLYH